MSKIEMMEVNQHTSDEVAKVLADLEAQGVDLAALQAALTAQGTNINTILSKVQNSGGGLTSCIRHVQRGTGTTYNTVDIALSGFSDVNKMIVLLNGAGGSANTGSNNVNSNTVFAGVDFYVSALTVNKLTVALKKFLTAEWTGPFSYQVIEFY